MPGIHGSSGVRHSRDDCDRAEREGSKSDELGENEHDRNEWRDSDIGEVR